MTSEATKAMISITANTSISVKPDLGLVLHIRGVCCGAGPSPPANGTDQDCPAAASALILLRCGYDRIRGREGLGYAAMSSSLRRSEPGFRLR